MMIQKERVAVRRERTELPIGKPKAMRCAIFMTKGEDHEAKMELRASPGVV